MKLAVTIGGTACLFFSYLFHGCDEIGIEQSPRWARVPFSMVLIEVYFGEMPQDTRHGYRAIAPLCKIEVEVVIFYKLISSNGTLR